MNDIVSLMAAGARKRRMPVTGSWYQHIGGNYHRYPAGMVKNSLRDFSPDAGLARWGLTHMPELKILKSLLLTAIVIK